MPQIFYPLCLFNRSCPRRSWFSTIFLLLRSTRLYDSTTSLTTLNCSSRLSTSYNLASMEHALQPVKGWSEQQLAHADSVVVNTMTPTEKAPATPVGIITKDCRVDC